MNKKILLNENEIPKQWYNIVADMKTKPLPPLNPATKKPMNPEDLESIFAKELVKQDANGISSFLKMTWTGAKVELIALTYSLHRSKRINNGQSSLDELKRKVEIIFNVDLGNMSANLRDMSRKKNPTQFLDILKKCFNDLIDKHLK